ncbi:MAG: hypothetical protein K1X55_13895 [Chitinophagales bacterium]|nr:hypothetical protein [Chitinophagales bacterium]
MTSSIDKRDILAEEPFSFKVYKNFKMQIFWKDKPVMLLKESESKKILKKIEHMPGKDVQLILAKITGNFKRGNEKDNKE